MNILGSKLLQYSIVLKETALPVSYALKASSPPQISEEFDQHLTEQLARSTSSIDELSLVQLQLLRWIKA